ncbi:MAG: dihydroorotase [Campylobacteraceae bacterium]|jgi:dihydroorotase|nr:dihydroorotase [Campylobacteraceae bacterium]MBT3882269.1 dihydroorotase [Campylobacteraceae bacterium]MBT4030324.1 dihydroorotase [Campylobacteraceae bacterium]MBT4179176.1 dihydroorotase [Campylobacteraceae bacterium]MBT4572372.1 dihydroorotase [Campylobacteraceae bacterium]
MKTITLKSPFDMHLHLRDNDMLKLVAPLTSDTFTGAIIMPNLVPPVDTKEAVTAYKNRIMDAVSDKTFNPMMTLFFKPYTKEFLEDVRDEITALKLYPAGITTNSEGGVESIDTIALAPTLNAMIDLDIPLCIHGETNGFVMDREAEFMSVYEELAIAFPKLKIIMEHITTKDAVEMVQKYDNLYATITLQHLLITLDDVAGGMLQPHLFCKPIAKRYEDRDALLNIALSGHPKIMFGSDSAPHPKHAKEACGCAAGVFTSPIALQVLVELFEKNNCLDNLQKFISDNACKIYNMKPSSKDVTLEKKDFIVPKAYEAYGETVVPMYAGETITWSIKS